MHEPDGGRAPSNAIGHRKGASAGGGAKPGAPHRARANDGEAVVEDAVASTHCGSAALAASAAVRETHGRLRKSEYIA